MTQKMDIDRIHGDARPQFVRSKKGAHNSGVSSAEPRVITGDEEATLPSILIGASQIESRFRRSGTR